MAERRNSPDGESCSRANDVGVGSLDLFPANSKKRRQLSSVKLIRSGYERHNRVAADRENQTFDDLRDMTTNSRGRFFGRAC